MQKTFLLILTGGFKGKTMRVMDFNFVDGECKVTGVYENLVGIFTYMNKCWEVQHREVSPFEEEQKGEEPAEQNDKLRQAISKLDKNNPEHWTAAGKPDLGAVEAIYGAPVSRKEVDACMK